MKNKILVLIATLVLGTPWLRAQSHDLYSRKEAPFKGLGSLEVLVEDFDPDAVKAGISKEELKVFVELKLRQNGVAIRKTNPHDIESPYLYINVNTMYLEKINHFTYSAEVSLNQKVQLLRNDTKLTAETWSLDVVGIIHKDRAQADIKEKVNSLLTFFLNAYLAANPKEKE